MQSFRTKSFYKGFQLEDKRELIGNILSSLWDSAFLISAEVARRRWVMLKIDGEENFYLGDNPVVFQHTENLPQENGLGFDVQGVEIFLPLHPKCALYMPCISTSNEIISGLESAAEIKYHLSKNIDLSSKNIANARKMLTLANNVISRNSKLYEALLKGGSIFATQSNIDNHNYLQCVWSHAAIYSNKNDFSFAARVFRENPQYRSTPRVSIRPYSER